MGDGTFPRFIRFTRFVIAARNRTRIEAVGAVRASLRKLALRLEGPGAVTSLKERMDDLTRSDEMISGSGVGWGGRVGGWPWGCLESMAWKEASVSLARP